jgi:hypothetical protein
MRQHTSDRNYEHGGTAPTNNFSVIYKLKKFEKQKTEEYYTGKFFRSQVNSRNFRGKKD